MKHFLTTSHSSFSTQTVTRIGQRLAIQIPKKELRQSACEGDEVTVLRNMALHVTLRHIDISGFR